MKESQSTSAILMVRPDTFGFDEQTAASNAFQNRIPLSQEEVRLRSMNEFINMVHELQKHDIHVQVFTDPDTSIQKPDAVFPNNWISMWPDGKIFLYPMATESRRVERSESLLAELKEQFYVTNITDLSTSEKTGQYLESTGAMIFDHPNKIVYGCVSPRCDATLFTDHAAQLGYTPVLFEATDAKDVPIYHTNVMMAIQSQTAVICSEAIENEFQRAEVLNSLHHTGHEIVEITRDQMTRFCGNVLELQNTSGEKFLAMSKTAYDGFTQAQRAVLSQDKTLLPFDIITIETIGGGSVRCMLGEIFLPKKQASAPNEFLSSHAAIV